MPYTFDICDTEEEVESHKSCWDNTIFEVSEKDIIALLEGKTLAAFDGEYGTFIKLEE